MDEQKFGGGVKVKDEITGFVGRITGYAKYYDGNAPQFYVEGIDATGRPIGTWVVVDRLSEVKDA